MQKDQFLVYNEIESHKNNYINKFLFEGLQQQTVLQTVRKKATKTTNQYSVLMMTMRLITNTMKKE